jgi:hypothetical protein
MLNTQLIPCQRRGKIQSTAPNATAETDRPPRLVSNGFTALGVIRRESATASRNPSIAAFPTLHSPRGGRKEYAVGHPEFLAISQSGRTIIVATPADTFDFIDVRHVTSIHLGGNGNQPHPQSRES